MKVCKFEDRHSVRPQWRHYFVVSHETVTLVEMVPALWGWNVHKITSAPIGQDWPDMSADEVVSWKCRNHGAIVCDEAESTRVVNLVSAKKG